MSNTLIVELEARTPQPAPASQELASPAAPAPVDGAGNGISSPPLPPASTSRVLGRLLHMADTYHMSGNLRQAIEMYFEISEKHPDTPEANRAEDTLMDIAYEYEDNGELRQARGIYERLL